MQTFKDSATQKVWQFEADVVATADVAGVYSFTAAHGDALNTPTTLQPYTIPAPTKAKLLATAQSAQIALVTKSCADAIVGGFLSTALGSAHTYPSNPNDQSNLIGCVASGLANVGFWCADSTGVWAIVSHTAAQIKQVLADGGTIRIGYSTTLDTKVKAINAATTVTKVKAIIW